LVNRPIFVGFVCLRRDGVDAIQCFKQIALAGFILTAANGKEVCSAEFALSEAEIRDVFTLAAAPTPPPSADTPEGSAEPTAAPPIPLPNTAMVIARRAYGGETSCEMRADGTQKLDAAKLTKWMAEKLPKFVLVREYDMSGEQVELDQLRQRLANAGNNRQSLSNDDQTILIILDLAAINLDEFITKGQTADGRTVRSFDKRSASRYLTKQFKNCGRRRMSASTLKLTATRSTFLPKIKRSVCPCASSVGRLGSVGMSHSRGSSRTPREGNSKTASCCSKSRASICTTVAKKTF
jgi:hypothetical protein